MKNVYLFQRPNEGDRVFLPYTVAMLWNYATLDTEILDNFKLQRMFFKRLDINTYPKLIKDPDICAFSVYTWNVNFFIKLAEQIKLKWPKCSIIFGGPEVTNKLSHYTFIDHIAIGSGEETFKEILQSKIHNTQIDRIIDRSDQQTVDISKTPSPYLTGMFDNIMKKNASTRLEAMIETTRGCPYGCTFCNWGGKSKNKIRKHDFDTVLNEIKWIGQFDNIKVIQIVDANFGIFKERDILIAEKIKETGKYVVYSNAKNLKHAVFDVANLLQENNRRAIISYDKKSFVFSLESLNKDTLKAIDRKNLDFEKTIQNIKTLNYNLSAELIIGLPFETRESFKKGIHKILSLDNHSKFIIFTLSLLNNTKMNEQRDLFNIKTIPSKLLGDIVISTSTMNFMDFIAVQEFVWTIKVFQCFSVIQLIANEAFNQYNVSYVDFYDLLHLKIQHNSKINNIIQETRSDIKALYQTGIVKKYYPGPSSCNYDAIMIMFDEHQFIWQTGVEVFKELTSQNLSEEVSTQQDSWENYKIAFIKDTNKVSDIGKNDSQ